MVLVAMFLAREGTRAMSNGYVVAALVRRSCCIRTTNNNHYSYRCCTSSSSTHGMVRSLHNRMYRFSTNCSRSVWIHPLWRWNKVVVPQHQCSNWNSNWNGSIDIGIGGMGRRTMMAFITGHKKTKHRNVRKQRARARRAQQQANTRDRQNGIAPISEKRKKLIQKINAIAASPDYPVPRSVQPEIVKPNTTNSATTTEKMILPPMMLTSTASPHVFLSKIFAQQLKQQKYTFFHGFAEAVQKPPTLFGQFRSCMPNDFGKDNYPPMNNNNHQKNPYGGASPISEVAFLGRSNVGKSSLINALMRQKLAMTSKTPGRTQSQYYYGWFPHRNNNTNTKNSHSNAGSGKKKKKNTSTMNIQQATGFLIDLPGYGYAKAPDAKVDAWQGATQDFLLQRLDNGTLRRVFLLQDARLEVPQNIDGSVASWMEDAGIPYTIVLTKADSIGSNETSPGVVKHANINAMRFHHRWMDTNKDGSTMYMSPFIHATSSKKNTGIAELLSSVFAEFGESIHGVGKLDTSTTMENTFADYENYDSDDENNPNRHNITQDAEVDEEGYYIDNSENGEEYGDDNDDDDGDDDNYEDDDDDNYEDDDEDEDSDINGEKDQ